MAQGPDHARCPRCRQVSTARHSRYVRTLKDLPAWGRRCRCGCVSAAGAVVTQGARSAFSRASCRASRRSYGRRTSRADVVTELIGQALGGRAGERLMGRLGLPVSDDTILRRLKKRARPAVIDARVVGVDEWAKRKGLNYGTIVVDLERRTVVDVLDTYDVEAVERWFSAHPQIHTICRDRNGRYAKAARTGRPPPPRWPIAFISCRICARPSNANWPCTARTCASGGMDRSCRHLPWPRQASSRSSACRSPRASGCCGRPGDWPSTRRSRGSAASRCRICSTGSRPYRRRSCRWP